LEEKEKKNIFDRVWSFFASVRLAIFILITLAVTSIIGTIVEQQAEPAKNIALLAKFFGDSTAPTVYNIFVKFGFMDMYHSWWFVGLLVLFSTNLIICTLERFPKTLRLVRSPLKPLRENAIKSLPIKKEIALKTNLKKAKDETLNSLRTSKYRVFESTEENSVQLYSQKGSYTRFGLYIVHISIILIFIGAIIGLQFGFKGFLNIPEGNSYSFAILNTGPLTKAERFERGRILDRLEVFQSDITLVANRLGLPVDVLHAKMKKYGIRPLGFSIKCNWYNTDYYSGTDTPREFQSELVIIENGREVIKKVIEVNHPLTYKGITFYQSSYGMVPNAVGVFVLKTTDINGVEDTLRLRRGESFIIPGTTLKGTIINFSTALARDKQTGALTTYSETMVNPAVAIEFDSPDMEKFTGWILKRYPETGILPDGIKITFEDYWGVEYTGLQVAKDPGVVLIYIASVIMTIGLYAAFFMSHKKIWIRLTPETSGKANSVRVSVGGSASKNRLAFEREIERIVSRVSHALEGKHPSKK
jgi:cytochrome c biogenesis protein